MFCYKGALATTWQKAALRLHMHHLECLEKVCSIQANMHSKARKPGWILR